MTTATVRTWDDMNALERRTVPDVASEHIPVEPSVCALYRDGATMCVGKATSLRSRLCGGAISEPASR